jgi:hypothetical protein
MTEQWFAPNAHHHGDAEGAPFLAAVRSLAPDKLGALIEPDATDGSSYPVAPFVLITLDISLTEDPGEMMLKVLFDGHGTLSGTWGGTIAWEGFDPKHPNSLFLHALSFSDEQFAAIAVDWIAVQLARPIVERQWTRRGEVVARVWATADNGEAIEVSGRQPFRGEPDIVRTVRAGSSP